MDEVVGRQLLAEQGWLSEMPADFRQTLLDSCRWRHLRTNQTLYVAGDPPGGIFGIAAGAIAMTSGFGAPGSPPGHLGRPGSWSGLGPLLSDAPRRATMAATLPTLVAYAPLPALRAMLERHPGWWQHFAQQLLIEFDNIASIANDLLAKEAMRRCAATLLRVAGVRHENASSGTTPSAPLPQSALAEMANLSRSSTSTILGELAERGLVGIEYRSIKLLDVLGLRRIADSD